MASDDVQRLLLVLVLILVVSQALGMLARRVGQPAVVGQIAAGIVLGPSALGPALTDRLLSAPVHACLTGLADLGAVLFVFALGYHLDRTRLRDVARPALCVASGAIVVPLAGGLLLALWLAPRHGVDDRLPFVLFVAAALSVTALPVLARILIEQRMMDTPAGRIALSSAVLSDAVAWVLLAVVVTVAGGTGQWHAALLPVYLVVLAVVGRRVLPLVFDRLPSDQARLSIVLVGLMLSALATEWLGLHFVFGAFAWGACLPRTHALTRTQITDRLEPAQALLLPIYFVVAGLSVDLVGLRGSSWTELAAVLAVAVVAKLAGAYTGAVLGAVDRRRALSVAVLMNTRGLTELIVLSAGFDLGVLDRSLYTVMVVMALVTTAMTVPLLRLTGAPADADVPVPIVRSASAR